MQPIQPRAHRTRLIVGFSIFALLALIASLGGCGKDPGSSNQQAPASPSPSPSPSPGAKKMDGDTPIVVKGGGSIDLDFSENVFYGTPPKCTSCKITKVELEQIKDTGDPIPPSHVLTPCVFTGDPIITIETNGNSDDITVKGMAGVVEIGFDKLKYPGVITECGDEKKLHSKSGEIKKVKVNGTECGGCTKWKRCKVTIHVY